MRTCCVKCRKNTNNIDSKIFRTKKIDYLCNQHVVIVKIKSHDL